MDYRAGEAGVLAEGAKTTAYTYIGEKITWDIYWHGTIGAAKKDPTAAWSGFGSSWRHSVVTLVYRY